MILGIGLRLGIGGYRGGEPPAPQPITGTTPLISALIDGQQLAEVVAWGSHESTAGITSDTKQMRISGGAWVAYVGTTEPAEAATVQVRQLVDDDAGSPQVIFTSNIVTVAAAPAVDVSVISGTFTDVGDTYDLTTDSPSDGNWHWARTATGVTLSADGSGGWTGGTVLASGTQAVGADNSSVTFDAGGTDNAAYVLHVYQRNAAGADSNVISQAYTKDGPPASVSPSIVTTAHTSGSTGGSGLVCALPASPTIGNWQLLFAGSDNIADFADPAGWTEVSPGDTAPGSVLQCKVYAREITAGNVGETTVTILNSTFKIAHGLVHEVQDTSGPGAYVQNLFQTLPSGLSHSGHTITTAVDRVRLFEALVFRTNLGGTSATGGAYAATNCLMVWGQLEMEVAGLSTALSYGTDESESAFAGVLVEMLPT